MSDHSPKPNILRSQADKSASHSLPEGPAMDAAVEADTSTAAQLILRARALEQVYKRTWRQEDVNARICLYLRALDLICEHTGDDAPLITHVSPVSEGCAANELLVREEDKYRNLTIGA